MKSLKPGTLVLLFCLILVAVMAIMRMTSGESEAGSAEETASVLEWLITASPFLLIPVIAYGGYQSVKDGNGTATKRIFAVVSALLLILALMTIVLGPIRTEKIIIKARDYVIALTGVTDEEDESPADKAAVTNDGATTPDIGTDTVQTPAGTTAPAGGKVDTTVAHPIQLFFNNILWIGLILIVAGVFFKRRGVIGIGLLMVLVAILFPGAVKFTGKQVAQRVTDTDIAFTCAAEPHQLKPNGDYVYGEAGKKLLTLECDQLFKRQVAAAKIAHEAEVAENERRAALIEAARPAPEPVIILPATTPSQVTVPACSSGNWAEVDIPGKWNVTPSWNYAAANYEVLQNGEWVTRNQKKPGMINMAVRFCTPQPRNVGKEMYLTWTSKP